MHHLVEFWNVPVSLKRLRVFEDYVTLRASKLVRGGFGQVQYISPYRPVYVAMMPCTTIS